jgi:hypothetical protein
MRWFLVTVSVVPSSPILVTLMKEALSSSKTSVLTRATQRNVPDGTILHSKDLSDKLLGLSEGDKDQDYALYLPHEFVMSYDTNPYCSRQTSVKNIYIGTVVAKFPNP